MSIDAGIHYFEARGTPYDVGVQLGRFGARIAHGYLMGTPAWRSVMAYRDDPRVEAAWPGARAHAHSHRAASSTRLRSGGGPRGAPPIDPA